MNNFEYLIGRRRKPLKKSVCYVIKTRDYTSLFRGFLSHFLSPHPSFMTSLRDILRLHLIVNLFKEGEREGKSRPFSVYFSSMGKVNSLGRRTISVQWLA